MAAVPGVSVVVPVYNGASFLAECLVSILQQIPLPAEIIVVDDGSTDDTPQVAAKFGDQIRYLHQQNQGPGAARNLGLSIAAGEFIGFLDADDRWHPDKLQIQIALLQQDSDRDGVWGMCQIMNTVSRGIDGQYRFQSSGSPCRMVQLGAFLFHRRVLERVNGFNVSRYQGEDFDLINRIEKSGMCLYRHDDVVVEYRRHDSNLTNNVQQAKVDLLAVLKRNLDRRRTASAQSADSESER
jgi:glycosyltransferase involved in cell wall biosynthesis